MAEAPGPEATPKKSKLILLIILTVAVLALTGGGYFVYTKFLAAPHPPATEGEAHAGKEEKKPEKKEEKKKEEKKEEKKKEGGKEGKGKEAEVTNMFDLEPFIVNLSDPKGKRYLKLKITLELESPEENEKAKLAVPKMRDMVIMVLTSLTFEEVMTPEGKIRVHDELLERFNQIMKPDRITNIYFTDFVVQ